MPKKPSLRRNLAAALVLAGLSPLQAFAACPLSEKTIDYFSNAAHTTKTASQKAFAISDGSVLFRARMMINFDGYAKAYHRDNVAGGAVLHLCNAADVYLPDGSHYVGSSSNAVCTGKFMTDYARIRSAGWTNPAVGAMKWYGVLARESLSIGGHTVRPVKPVEQADGSGFYVSPTALADTTIADEADQTRYIDATKIAGAVVRSPSLVSELSVGAGTFGVAFDPKVGKAVPFIVGDFGPRVGEATPFLARSVEKVSENLPYDREHRYLGGVDEARIVWIFFRGEKMAAPYTASSVATAASAAFETWGGEARLKECVSKLP
ncbi:hypothetical protein [Sinorhizobium sp. BG8]|uniref:hypothetical protein n=1 Tax=Sinorhizobium sp. BG8 TaxID=2613773 RepID=UPI00193DABB4|nr:hypothetical protein [Sinorhizobium sp. BG8]QRM54670.1 hypothetical protein F3Y30_09015 [Sinorhizobium sp. BG8]